MKVSFTHWKESDGKFLGYLNDHPDHWTQGETLEDLKEHLQDLFELFQDQDIPATARSTKSSRRRSSAA